MAQAERQIPKEDEKKRRRVDLTRFSHRLSHTILRSPTDGSISPEVPSHLLNLFESASLNNRDNYWKGQQNSATFGQQMIAWLGNENTVGISQWVDAQQDPDVIAILKSVGLSREIQPTQALLVEQIAPLVEIINTDLTNAGMPALNLQSLSDSQMRSLIFYNTYLASPEVEEGAKHTKNLIDTVINAAKNQSTGDSTATINMLQKVAPLLRIAGEDAQYALGALTVAEVHGASDQEIVKQAASQNSSLNTDEQDIVNFFQAESRRDFPDPLESGKTYDIAQVFQPLVPDADPQNPYFIENIPVNVSEQLASRFSAFKHKEPIVLVENNEQVPNKKIFGPSLLLEEKGDKRFIHANALVGVDSNLIALAAASAATPEKQKALYQQLATTVDSIHINDPKLLGEFLGNQNELSQAALAGLDYSKAASIIRKKIQQVSTQLEATLSEEIKSKFGSFDENNPTPEQMKFIQDRFLELTLSMQQEILKDISQYPDRFLVLSLKDNPDPDAIEKYVPIIDIPKTVESWKDRIPALQEVLKQDPLTLTPEQIRQIEFLSHAVNIERLMKWMRGEDNLSGSPVDAVKPQPRLPEAAAAVEQPTPGAVSPSSLMQQHEGVGALAPNNQEPTPPPSELVTTSTAGQDIGNLMTQEDKA